MAELRGTKLVVLSAAQAITGATTGSEIVIPDGYTRIQVVLNITAKSGTSPTLNVYLQNAIRFAASTDTVGALPTGTVTWNDLVSFAQATNTGTQYASFIESTGFVAAAQDGALTAGTIRAGVIGNRLRVKFATGGSSPSFTCSVVAQLLP